MKVKNIMFDLGGVIMTIDQQCAVKRFQELGLRNADKLLDSYTQTGIFGKLEEGEITADDFIQELGNIVGRKLSFAECQYAWQGYTKEVPKRNIRILNRLRSDGYRLILISNTNPFMMDWGMSKDFSGDGRGLSEFFDSLYLSYKMKLMKPDKKMFYEIINNENIKPEETLFVDDSRKNIDVGNTLGFQTYCPNNGTDWTNDLYKILTSIS